VREGQLACKRTYVAHPERFFSRTSGERKPRGTGQQKFAQKMAFLKEEGIHACTMTNLNKLN